jgi:hypothetical protein
MVVARQWHAAVLLSNGEAPSGGHIPGDRAQRGEHVDPQTEQRATHVLSSAMAG